MSLLDLAPIEEIEAHLERRRAREKVAEVPFLESAVGPGRPWPAGVNWRKSFPVPLATPTAPVELRMVNFTADPAMIATLGPYDIVLLDTSIERRSPISPDGLYVIERNREAVMRYIRSGTNCYYLVTDADWDTPTAWEPLALSTAQLSAAIKARVVWLGRERDRDVQPQRGRFLYDPISS